MTALPTLGADDFSREPALLADALRDRGACWIADWPDAALCNALREDLRRLQSTGSLSAGAVGRRESRAFRNDIRADATCWLDDPRCGDPARTFLTRLGTLRTILNRTLFLGLTDCEAHYAAYPSGGGYARHRDRFRDSDARVVTWVTYLNADWAEDDAGELRLHLGSTDIDEVSIDRMSNGLTSNGLMSIDVPPVGGSLCFLSELEHEVLPTRRERLSIAAWFRRAPREFV
ncbi:MAG: 2OG-Fe(II) oxygenase [Xanthomonadales bacterium]|nr:2OG-Fe(II) oxygenase [Xanthomonadales bacterium]